MITLEMPLWSWPASGVAVGLGVWVFFGWVWLAGRHFSRGEFLAQCGFIAASAFAGGLAAGWAAGEPGLSSLGALGGGGLAACIAFSPWRRGGREKLDVVVPAGIAGLATARLGCLLEGCDFGRITDTWPAVVYGRQTYAFDVHVAEYGLSPFAQSSLAVHPFAGYLALWGAICAAVGAFISRRKSTPGRAATTSAVLFLAGGGVIEWLREPATVLSVGDGVSVYPFLYGGAAMIVAALWVIAIRRTKETT